MPSFTERYHELTKYDPATIDKLGSVIWEEQPPAFKDVADGIRVDLRPWLKLLDSDFKEASWDRWSATPGHLASLETLSQLLFFTLGVTARFVSQEGQDFYLRAAPSAGGMYPTEIYVVLKGIKGDKEKGEEPVADGIYHYHSLHSALIPVWQGDFSADLRHYFLKHPAIENCRMLFIFTGIYQRSAWRYKERAYRRILLDTGHALSNLLEICEHKKLGATVLGGFIDQGLEDLLFLSHKEEFPLLAVAISEDLNQHSLLTGQNPSPEPAKAVIHANSSDPVQVQQNTCERIWAMEEVRPPIPFQLHYQTAIKSPPNIFKTIALRRSCRQFAGLGIKEGQMREILSYAYRSIEGTTWDLAPGLLQAYVVVHDVKGIQPGIYMLNAETQELKTIRKEEVRTDAYYNCLEQALAFDSSFLLVHTVHLPRLTQIYGDRGYRYACLNAGQIGERLNIMAVHLGLGATGIGAYYDNLMNEMLELSPEHAILYISAAGVVA